MQDQPTEEWGMVEALFKIHEDLPPDAEDWILELYNNLDPYEPFQDQLVGLPEAREKKVVWLYSLYAKFVDEDPELAEEMWEEFDG